MSNQNIAFIDRAVINYESLIAGIKPKTSVVVLDSTKDGVKQITEAFQGGKYKSVHIVSHGSEASLQLGATQLNEHNLGAYTQQLQQWASALTDNADILLYGCNVAAGEKGEAFIQELNQVTGANIAASNNLTGNADLGGDWNLKVKTGKIESSLAFDAETLSKYKSILAIGPDDSGYIAASTNFQSDLNLVLGDAGVVSIDTLSSVDDVAATIDLGTNTFRFYGVDYTGNDQLFVSANGLITFGVGNAGFVNDDLTTTSDEPDISDEPEILDEPDISDEPAIAVAWDDWVTNVDTPPDDLVLYKFNDINSDGINDQLVIEWNNVHHFSNRDSGDSSYQAILELNTGTKDGNIIFNYTDLSIPNTDVDEAGSATVGIKAGSSQGSNRLLISQDTTASPYVGTGRAILITRSVPLLDLNGEQSAAVSGIDYRTSFAQGIGAASIVDSTNLSLLDSDSPTLASATITITNLLDGAAEVLETTTAGTNITASYNSTTGILSLTGNDTVANYQQVLRTITYNNTAASPNPTNRIITFVVSDGTYTSPLATTTLGINAPVLDLNGAASGINYTADFPGGTAVSIVDTTNLTLIDPDNPNLASATVTITNLRNSASEVLAANTTGTNETIT